ncbi:MAG: GlxA family transcriptional regulator [Pararhodobacter sp.]
MKATPSIMNETETAKPHAFALVLCPGFSQLALPLMTEPLFVANWLTGRRLFTWRTLSTDGLAVPSSAGPAVPVDAPLGPDDEADTVLVAASFDTRRSEADARLLAWLRRMSRSAALLGGIETGSELLAAAGLLQGRRVAVHWYNIEGFRERFPATMPENCRLLVDGRHASCAGALATMDLMLALIQRHAGSETAAEVARHLLAPDDLSDMPAPAPPVTTSSDPLVARALDMIGDRLGEGRDCAGLARALGLSLRQLQRRFQAAQGQSLDAAWREAQFARAHQLVQQTGLSLTEISVTVGFGSLEAFSRAYRDRFGIPPSRDRLQSTRASVFGPPGVRGKDRATPVRAPGNRTTRR